MTEVMMCPFCYSYNELSITERETDGTAYLFEGKCKECGANLKLNYRLSKEQSKE